jgi:hypothetical protein
MNGNFSKWMAAVLGILIAPSMSFAWEDPSILQVEEDWELVVLTPDPLQDSPQISTWMSPTRNMGSEHFGLDLNHTLRNSEIGGGFQTKALRGESLIESKLHDDSTNLHHEGEVLRWTQVMSIHGGSLYFSIKNGTSQSWGTFGGTNTTVSLPSSLSNLNQYSHQSSLSWSGVGYASNRVGHLKLVRVRKIDSNGQIVEQSIDTAIDSNLQ